MQNVALDYFYNHLHIDTTVVLRHVPALLFSRSISNQRMFCFI